MDIKKFYQYNWAKEQPLSLMDKYEKIINILKDRQSQRILDVGCGEGDFSLKIKKELNLKEIFAVDISEKAVAKAIERGVNAYSVDVNEEVFPFPDSFFDAIFCGEVIEHLFDPDYLLDEVYRILKEDGLFIITTPNLASWFNRLVFIFGYQPFFTEVSTRKGLGHLFPFWLNAGHIRVFTLGALKEMLGNHNFNIEKCYGFGINTKLGYGKKFTLIIKIINFILSSFPSLASDIMVVCRKLQLKL